MKVVCKCVCYVSLKSVIKSIKGELRGVGGK